MYRENIHLNRPAGTKIYRRGSTQYVYYATGSEYKKDKKYVVEKRVCIGKMVSDSLMVPNENFFQFFYVDTNEEDAPDLSDSIQIGSTLLVRKIMEDLKLTELVGSIHGEDAKIICDMIAYMLIRRTSAMQHYPDFAWGHLVCSARYWDDSKISELFKNRISYTQIEKFITQWNRMQPEHSKIYISYDSTNMNTLAEGVEMAEFGHAKDNDDKPQVNISYAVNHDDSTPLFYEMYPGSIIDNTQCTHMVDRAREYGYRNVGLILDRGYFSISNIQYFDKNGYDFLMMIKSSSALVSDMLEDAKLPLSTKAKYYLPEHEVYALTKTGKIGDDLLVRYFHIYYDNVRGNQEKNEYLRQLQKKEEHLQKKIKEKLNRREDMQTYEKLFRLKYDDYGYLISYKRNEKKIQQEIDRLGFFVIVTSKKMDASEALNIYRKRDSVEKIFRMLKTGLEYDTFRVHSQASLESKTYVMFLASIVRNYMYQRLREVAQKENDRKNYTVPAALSQLERITATKNSKGTYIRRYGLTSRQKRILNQFGINESYLNNAVKELNDRI